MSKVTDLDNTLSCSCGAVCSKAKDRRRFLARHPAMCSNRAKITKSLSTTGTRCVDDNDGAMEVENWECEHAYRVYR